MIREPTPDLGSIAARAVTEVLATQLRLLATRSESVEWPIADRLDESLVGAVTLAGSRLSGDVELRIPDGFIAKVARLLLGRCAADTEEAADITGELCNMLAGKVAADLAAAGYPTTLSTPTVSRGIELKPDNALGTQTFRSNWTCEGYLLSVMLKIRFGSR
jgi:CheY-specific phosphatase CheX